MTAFGADHRRLTFTPAGLASSQPSSFPDKTLELAARWSAAEKPGDRPAGLDGFDADVADVGGTPRVVLTHRGDQADTGNGKLVAFLYQP